MRSEGENCLSWSPDGGGGLFFCPYARLKWKSVSSNDVRTKERRGHTHTNSINVQSTRHFNPREISAEIAEKVCQSVYLKHGIVELAVEGDDGVVKGMLARLARSQFLEKMCEANADATVLN
jgi:hypothetical protein